MPENEESQQPAADAAAWEPTHEHFKGGLYRLLGKGVRGAIKAGATISTSKGEILVTEDIAEAEEFVIYENAGGDMFAQPAVRFFGVVAADDKSVTARFKELPVVPGAGDDVPTQDNAQPAGEKPKAGAYTMNAAEILDRFHLAQATLNGAPVMALLGEVIGLLLKGAADEPGKALGRRLAIVTNEAVNAAKAKAGKPTIIMPGNAPGVPNGLGSKPRH